MSDWASVIVCWSGLDDEIPDDASVDSRLKAIDSEYKKLVGFSLRGWVVSYSCGNKSIGYTNEVTAIAHTNNFDQEKLVEALRGLSWENPLNVEVFWKSEQMDRYEREGITDAR